MIHHELQYPGRAREQFYADPVVQYTRENTHFCEVNFIEVTTEKQLNPRHYTFSL